MSKKSESQLEAAGKVIVSIKARMKQPHVLSKAEAAEILEHLRDGEVDVYLSLTQWYGFTTSILSGGKRNVERFDTRDDNSKAIRSSVLITNQRIFFLCEKQVRIVEPSELEGWDLCADDTYRMSKIELIKADSVSIRFKVSKTAMDEFREALLQFGLEELDPPTNPQFFYSSSMNLNAQYPEVDSDIPLSETDKAITITPQMLLQPRHLKPDTP